MPRDPLSVMMFERLSHLILEQQSGDIGNLRLHGVSFCSTHRPLMQGISGTYEMPNDEFLYPQQTGSIHVALRA